MKTGRPKIDLDFIKNKFLEGGYTVLSNLYNGSKDKIKFICSNDRINYNKKDCRPDNLINICRSCYSSANFDRDWYKMWYQTIIKRR
jgi:hypothetical protein